ncbi:hypothetical protein J6590_013842 [Homalodisca vitripennis]|nr:hypothetical protein J6590_013842 [Homalodisca vitripennis]
MVDQVTWQTKVDRPVLRAEVYPIRSIVAQSPVHTAICECPHVLGPLFLKLEWFARHALGLELTSAARDRLIGDAHSYNRAVVPTRGGVSNPCLGLIARLEPSALVAYACCDSGGSVARRGMARGGPAGRHPPIVRDDFYDPRTDLHPLFVKGKFP